ncbi:hypothetical protein, partial [Mesorhizobium sp.]|uniref:hypothetical protein n=1 Tax=Mesorhizobium sp. TaxID=1871066 RepID=UPI00257E6D15
VDVLQSVVEKIFEALGLALRFLFRSHRSSPNVRNACLVARAALTKVGAVCSFGPIGSTVIT